MWLITTQGFYSVVADREDPNRLLVRARDRADLEALAAQIPGLELIETPEADYRWRASVTRGQWNDAIALLANAIDYPNFKAAVGERQGSERASVYGRVWAELMSLQRRSA